jgi:hypothetical protein
MGLTMSKKKPSGDDSQRSPRTPIQLDKRWADIARKLAAANRQPVAWFLVSLIEEKAKSNLPDESLPPMPWEDEK